MASLVVDAAYVHHGTAAASADNINGWSEAALKRIKPKAFKRRLESALGLSIERACWCAARDGRAVRTLSEICGSAKRRLWSVAES